MDMLLATTFRIDYMIPYILSLFILFTPNLYYVYSHFTPKKRDMNLSINK